MRKLLLIALFLFSYSSFSQITDGEKKLKSVRTDTVDGWKRGGLININFTQVSLTNWAAGGENSISLNGFSSLFANLKKGKSTWDNTLVLAFGQVKQGGSKYIKSDDKIQFTSKYGRKASQDWYYAGLLDFQTQFTVGYSDAENSRGRISDFMAPGYFLGAIGMDYKPSSNFTVFISPVTAKLTVVNDDDLAKAGAFGVQGIEYSSVDSSITTQFENTRLEVGGYLRMMYKREVMENVSYQTNLGLFSSYTDDPTHIDVNWDNIINMKVNKYINASFTTSLIYDHDISIQDNDGKVGPRTQFKYVLGVGFAYKFGDK